MLTKQIIWFKCMCIYRLSFILLFATKHYFYCSIVYIHCDFFVIRKCNMTQLSWGPSWSWSYGSWIYNYLRNQCLSPLKLWVHGDTTLYDKVCQWLVTGRWFSLVSSTNKTELHDIYNWNNVESGVKHHKTTNQPVIADNLST